MSFGTSAFLVFGLLGGLFWLYGEGLIAVYCLVFGTAAWGIGWAITAYSDEEPEERPKPALGFGQVTAVGCGLVVVGFAGCFGYHSMRVSSPPPAASVPGNSAQAKGLVPLAGRVNPGTKVYWKFGDFVGTVVQPVVTWGGQECVAVKKSDGTLKYISRESIRYDGTWFTDPN